MALYRVEKIRMPDRNGPKKERGGASIFDSNYSWFMSLLSILKFLVECNNVSHLLIYGNETNVQRLSAIIRWRV
jgi:hypothetical protein